MHFFLDILATLSRLSLQLQADSLTLPKLLANFETALLTLVGMRTEDGDKLEEYKQQSHGQFDGVDLTQCSQDTSDTLKGTDSLCLTVFSRPWAIASSVWRLRGLSKLLPSWWIHESGLMTLKTSPHLEARKSSSSRAISLKCLEQQAVM